MKKFISIFAILSVFHLSCNNFNHNRYDEILFIQWDAMNDDIYSTYLKLAENYSSDELSMVVLPIVDSLDALIHDVRAIPKGLRPRDEIDSVDALVFSSGRIQRVEDALIDLAEITSGMNQPLPGLLVAKNYKAPNTLTPWRYILFYHVLRKDAIIRLQLVRNDLLFLIMTKDS